MTFKEKIKKFIPKFLIRLYHYKLALIGAVLFGFPGKSKKIKIIGVTGTSGKSTTVDLICKIFEEAGFNVASISSIRFKIGKKEWENKYKMTMPGRFVIQSFLRQAVNNNCQFVVLEVTSEGIRQFRHKFINFDTAVFTNLSHEHIESHGGFDKYRNEKIKLFKATKNIHIINADDENAKYFLDVTANKKVKFSISDVQDIKMENGISYKFKNINYALGLMGRFNILNSLASIYTANAYGISYDVCKRALEKAKNISGRMEVVNESPKIIIDYAHTPDQLEAVYKTFPESRLICVLGSCGGGRDKWKRPVLGKIAKQYCSKIFVTNEDPYDENPEEIIDVILKEAGENAEKIISREEAINQAVKISEKDNVVIITGKGSEIWMCLENGKKIPWSDKKIAIDALGKIKK